MFQKILEIIGSIAMQKKNFSFITSKPYDEDEKETDKDDDKEEEVPFYKRPYEYKDEDDD